LFGKREKEKKRGRREQTRTRLFPLIVSPEWVDVTTPGRLPRARLREKRGGKGRVGKRGG